MSTRPDCILSNGLQGHGVYARESGVCIAVVSDFGVMNNPAACAEMAQRIAPVPLVCWSGWTGETCFAVDPRAWSVGAWKNLESACEAVQARLAPKHGGDAPANAGASIWLRPHARHVLSDSIRCERFMQHLGGSGGGRIGIVAEPAALFTRAMLVHASDHLERSAHSAARWSGLRAVLASNVVEPSSGAPDELSGTGAFDNGSAFDLGPTDMGLIAPAPLRAVAREIAAANGVPCVWVE